MIQHPSFVLLVLTFVLYGCIEELELFPGDDKVLVVEGGMTDLAGSAYVKMYHSTSFNVISEFINDAQVRIIDNHGNVEVLENRGHGIYLGAFDFAGVPGRVYHLDVKMRTGAQYKSIADTLMVAPEIDILEIEERDGMIDFFVSFQDNPNCSDFYRFRYHGTFEFNAPLAQESSEVRRCWIGEWDQEFLKLEADYHFNGQYLNHYKLFSMILDDKMQYGYHMSVGLYALSSLGYSYWEAIRTQLNNTGSIFESSNFRIRGNVVNTEKSDEYVLGFFQVAGVKEKYIFIDEFAGSFGFPAYCNSNPNDPPPAKCSDCREFSTDATNVKPGFWPR